MKRFLIVLAFLTGCDQLNKPIGHPANGSSGTTSTTEADADAGTVVGAEAGAPPPVFTAQPGDIQL